MKKIATLYWIVVLMLLSITVQAQRQYASRVIAFGSEYTSTDWSAQQALGAPNVNMCASVAQAWASLTADGSREFLELEYTTPAIINRIYIHEIYNPGAVDTVYVFNPNTQQFETVFSATAKSASGCPRVMAVRFLTTSFPVSKIRIAINSPVVSGWNEIDAVGIDRIEEGGAIGTDQTVCIMEPGAMFTSTEPGFSGVPAVVYQWQDSTENGSWNDIAGAAAVTYQPPVVAVNTWYRRKASLGTAIAFSNEVKLTVVGVGDPTVFPLNSWNFYAHKGVSLDLTGTAYRGFYSRNVFDINTDNDFNAFSTPASAAGYSGCPLVINNFTFVSKRKGFPAGNYVMKINSVSGTIRAYVNGILAGQAVSSVISLGALDAASEVEIRQLGNDSRFYQKVQFIITNLTGGEIGANQLICVNDVPALFTNIRSAYGGAMPATITYQWQDSVANGSWQDIVNATSATYQSPAVPTSKWFRRKAVDNSNTVAYSNEVKVATAVVAGDASVYPLHTWNYYAFNGTQLSLADAKYRGFYTAPGLKFNTSQYWNGYNSPSTATGYSGCPVNYDNFILSGRRRGFPAGTYELRTTSTDDRLLVLVDGVEKFNGGCCGTVNIGKLNAGSKVEMRLQEIDFQSLFSGELRRIDSAIYEYSANNCFSFTLQGTAGNEWLDITDANSNIVASINPNGNDLGTVTVSIRHFGNGSSNIPLNTSNNKRYLPRYFNITSSAYPGGNFPTPVRIRLYFKNSEMDDYKLATSQPNLSLAGLHVTHYNGTNEDCDMGNNDPSTAMIDPVAGGFTPGGFYLEATTPGFSEFGVVGGTQTLPVTLTKFKATVADGKVLLDWTTSQELDNKGFEVLRSRDGRYFEKIGWVDGNGTTNTQHRYTFTDVAPHAGKGFYRLRQVDIDGNASLTDIYAITTKEVFQFSISPNPVESTLYLELDEKKVSSIRITDMQGRVVWQRNGRPSSSVMSIPVQLLTRGIYLLEVTDEQGNRQTGRFVKK